MPLQFFNIQLANSYKLSKSVRHFLFNLSNEESFSFIPGQFIRLHFRNEQGVEIRRSYSLANSQSPCNTIEFAASYIDGGFASNILFNLKTGDALSMSGPVGKLILNQDTHLYKRHIFVATGTGITPFLSMLPQLSARLESKEINEVLILQGVQTRQDLLYGESFKKFCNNHQGASFLPCFSREPVANLNEQEYSGYVQSQFDSLSLNPQSDKLYLCGNPAMIDEAYQTLKERDFENKQIIREKYISSK
jgi:ferredoxin-NADP reductase